jgi:hypothetical protein
VDVVNGVRVTCIDNGMPVVVMRADQMGRTGYETREALDDDAELKARVEAIRLAVGPMMNLGDVTEKTVPKMIRWRRRVRVAQCVRARSSRTVRTPPSACSRRSASPPRACCPMGRRRRSPWYPTDPRSGCWSSIRPAPARCRWS